MLVDFFEIVHPLMLAMIAGMLLATMRKTRFSARSFDSVMLYLVGIYAFWELMEALVGISPEMSAIVETLVPWFYLLLTLTVLVLVFKKVQSSKAR